MSETAKLEHPAPNVVHLKDGDYILVAGDVFATPIDLAALKPERVLIPQEAIDEARLSMHFSVSHRKLDRFVEKLQARGVRVLPRRLPRGFDILMRILPPGMISRQHVIRRFASENSSPAIRFFTPPPNFPYRGSLEPITVVHWLSIISGPFDTDVLDLARELKQSSFKNQLWLLIRLLFYALLAFAAIYTTRHLVTPFLQQKTSSIGFWPLAGICSAGFLLFLWRERLRLSYGILEVVVGAITSYAVFPTRFSDGAPDSVIYLQLLAGLYIIVRGLDNIGKGLVGTVAERGWRRIFEGPPPSSDDEALISPAISENATSVRVDRIRDWIERG